MQQDQTERTAQQSVLLRLALLVYYNASVCIRRTIRCVHAHDAYLTTTQSSCVIRRYRRMRLTASIVHEALSVVRHVRDRIILCVHSATCTHIVPHGTVCHDRHGLSSWVDHVSHVHSPLIHVVERPATRARTARDDVVTRIGQARLAHVVDQ